MPFTTKPKKKAAKKKKKTTTKSRRKKPARKKPAGTLTEELARMEDAWQDALKVPIPDNPLSLEPGIYDDIPFEDYCRIPAVNNSKLGAMLESPLHYRYTPPREDAPHFAFGTLIHDGCLEPEKLAERYIVLPEEDWIKQVQAWAMVPGNRYGNNRQGEPKPGKLYDSPKASGMFKDLRAKFMQLHPGKQEVSVEWFNNLAGMLRQLQRNPRTKDAFTNGKPEVTIIWDDPQTGVRCKGRIDFLQEGHKLKDLKTSVKGVAGFSLDDFGYHRQSAMYSYGYHVLTGIPLEEIEFEFVVVEKTPPFACDAAPACDDAFAAGLAEYHTLIGRVFSCQKRNNWPGPKAPDGGWPLSPWYRNKERKLEQTFN